MAGKTEEQKRLEAIAAKQAARAKETDEQKWLRAAIREELTEALDEMFTDAEEDKKDSGGSGFSFGKMLGIGG